MRIGSVDEKNLWKIYEKILGNRGKRLFIIGFNYDNQDIEREIVDGRISMSVPRISHPFPDLEIWLEGKESFHIGDVSKVENSVGVADLSVNGGVIYRDDRAWRTWTRLARQDIEDSKYPIRSYGLAG